MFESQKSELSTLSFTSVSKLNVLLKAFLEVEFGAWFVQVCLRWCLNDYILAELYGGFAFYLILLLENVTL